MKILLLSCPDATHPLFPRFSKSPQLGLSSIAANVADIADVSIGDLVLQRRNVRQAIRRAMADIRPQVVGISAMAFQYHTAKKIADLVRSIDPEVRVVLGGYHATLNGAGADPEAVTHFDFLVRGEGEHTFRELILALQGKGALRDILGLSFVESGALRHNAARAIIAELNSLPLPARERRIWKGYHIHGRPFDHIETSRGCTLPCTFCSITQHYGRNYRTLEFDRVLRDIEVCQRLGSRELFIVDDNITLNPKRFEALLDAMIEARFDDMWFSTQGSIQGLYGRPTLIEKMARAKFNLVFLGIENMSPETLDYFRKGKIADKTTWVLDQLRAHDIITMGGFILGSPDDTEADVVRQFDFMRERSIDSLLVQILTPYPGTPLTVELERDGFIVNRDLRRYSGFFANVRTRHLTSRQLDFLRWKHLPYYRDLNWFRRSVTMRRYPFRVLFREGLARAAEWLRETMRRRFFGEEHAFLKFQEEQLNLNNFFDEPLVPSWPDDPMPAPPAQAKHLLPAR